MTNDDIKKQLLELADSQYQIFSSGLIPNVNNDSILGVRLPQLRKIAKSIIKGDWEHYLRTASNDSFEEIMLQGMVIGYVKEDLNKILPYVKGFISRINNWSVCDSFCSGLKLPKVYSNEMWEFILPYLKDSREYYIRFGVVMLIFYYVDEKHIEDALALLDAIDCDAYYVKMAVAWAISIYYIRFPGRTMMYLNNNHLDTFTYNKALQKITESLKVDKDTKMRIRDMKRR